MREKGHSGLGRWEDVWAGSEAGHSLALGGLGLSLHHPLRSICLPDTVHIGWKCITDRSEEPCSGPWPAPAGGDGADEPVWVNVAVTGVATYSYLNCYKLQSLPVLCSLGTDFLCVRKVTSITSITSWH